MSDPEVSAATAQPDPAHFGGSRSKTVTWYDPMILAAAAPGMTGLEFLTSLLEGRYPPPPIASLVGMRPVSVRPGDVVFQCLPDESVYNPIGVVHGGLVCTLLDTVAACAVHSTLPAGVGYTSIEIKVSYLRPVRAGIELTAHGWVTKPGRRVAFAEGDVRDPSGAVLATASTTCLVMG
ncbi:uncharacterized protein (TIGR00369 family) [Nakamurella sp. UYEF19]|uniref:PaaI family thioesterase n=1 Tax=Nakamurella sp. UYEF19 TaxID=1756392 RepID=UPI003399F67F